MNKSCVIMKEWNNTKHKEFRILQKLLILFDSSFQQVTVAYFDIMKETTVTIPLQVRMHVNVS
jgi:hypothetical protein